MVYSIRNSHNRCEDRQKVFAIEHGFGWLHHVSITTTTQGVNAKSCGVMMFMTPSKVILLGIAFDGVIN